MPAPEPRKVIAVLLAAFCAGCGQPSVPPPKSPATIAAATTRNVPPPPEARYRYDAYGPFQWSPFSGTSRDNVYIPATGPTTGPANDSVLIPTDATPSR